MRFRVRTYFGEKRKGDRIIGYIFNTLYRSIIPMFILYAIIDWDVSFIVKILLGVIMSFFVLYQFSWEVE